MRQNVTSVNWAYAFNTFVRSVGSMAFIELIALVLKSNYDTIKVWSIMNNLELLKSTFLFLGFVLGYVLTAYFKQLNFVNDFWFLSNSIFYLVLGVSWGFIDWFNTHHVLTLILLTLLSVSYKTMMGIRDAVRIRLYKAFSVSMLKDSTEQSDLIKNLQRERKSLTNMADYLGGVVVFVLMELFRNQFSISRKYIYMLMCLVASAFNMYSYFLTRDILIEDTLMTGKKYDRFLTSEFFNLRKLLIMPEKDKLLLVRVFLLKVALGLSKSYFLNKAFLCLDFNITKLTAVNVLLQTIVFLIDYLQSIYRRKYGKQLLSSFASMSISGILILCSSFLLRVGIQSSSSTMILMAYIPSLIASNLLISSLNHLFEVWNIDDTSDSELMKSYRLNLLSLGSSWVGKLSASLLESRSLFLPVQVLSVLLSWLISLKLVLNAGESI